MGCGGACNATNLASIIMISLSGEIASAAKLLCCCVLILNIGTRVIVQPNIVQLRIAVRSVA